MKLPNKAEYTRAVKAFKRHEKRDAMYVVATYWIKKFWSDSHQLSNGLGVLLLTWNNACYRYGPFDFDELAECIDRNRATLKKLRSKKFRRYSAAERETVTALFNDFQYSLRSPGKNGIEKLSPVGTVKALHLLAPKFFPLWDMKIAIGYGCRYNNVNGAVKYLEFCDHMNELIAHVTQRGYVGPEENPLKKIDEYNYVTFTNPKWLMSKSNES